MSRTAVVAEPRRAYVVRGSMFGTDMYYCAVDQSGLPICDEVMESDK